MNVSNVSNNNYFASAEAAAPAQPQRQVAQAARAVNQSGALGRNQIVFTVDSQTRQRVVLIEDRETHDVVRQIPPEYVLELAQNLHGPSSKTNPAGADT
ncbi:MAG TPA: flagellar protein FlaG [Bryobacteraceae bacterium]|nr:flagellar protein FlaG [Bryobacteraceae bacterium]